MFGKIVKVMTFPNILIRNQERGQFPAIAESPGQSLIL